MTTTEAALREALERLDLLHSKGVLTVSARETIHFAVCAIDAALSETPPSKEGEKA